MEGTVLVLSSAGYVAPQLRETGTPHILAQRSSLLEYSTARHRTNQLSITNDMGTRVRVLQMIT